MHLPDHILGVGAVKAIQERIKAPVLTIGTDRFTRAHLASISCFNFLAASTLSNIVTKALKVENTRDLFYNVPPGRLALPGLGTISLATLGAAFEHKLGKTLSDYIDHHRAENEKVVTFDSIKRHSSDTKAEKRTKESARHRRHGRNAAAHELRTNRFLQRKAGTRAAAPAQKPN